MGVDRCELDDHLGSAQIVECARKLFISLLQESEDVEVALMMASRGIQAKALELLESSLAEPLESDFSELAEQLPIGFGRGALRDHLIAA